MRRLARRLFTLCSAASLVLCVAVCVLWMRSYWRRDVVSVTRDHGFVEAELTRGAVRVNWITRARPSPGEGWYHASEPARPEEAFFTPKGRDRERLSARIGRFGFQIVDVRAPDVTYRTFRIPHALLAIVAAALPVCSMRRLWHYRKRRRLGFCPSCG
jgi:hypothetical protein